MSLFDKIASHVGHNVTVAVYGTINAVIECEDCMEIVIDADQED